VGPQLQRADINDNLTLSSRRAGDVVTYLVSQGVNPNIISAKGCGDTHPVASNDMPADRAKNRRIVITVQGPGAPGAEYVPVGLQSIRRCGNHIINRLSFCRILQRWLQ
jgi:hypothetical protein